MRESSRSAKIMETTVVLVMIALSAFGAVISGIFVIIGALLLRANQKMYTEYFKDRSMANRDK